MESDITLGWRRTSSGTGTDLVSLRSADLATHVFICGVTGTGKTVVGKNIIEECLRNGIPVIAIELKPDVSSLAVESEVVASSLRHKWLAMCGDPSWSTYEAEWSRQMIGAGRSMDDVRDVFACVAPSVMSLRAMRGPTISSSPIPARPSPERMDDAATTAAVALVDLLLDKPGARDPEAVAFFKTLLQFAWNRSISLEGKQGLEKLVAWVEVPPVEEIGVQTLDAFISPRRRKILANRLNAILVSHGAGFDGIRIDDIDALLARPSGWVPLTILNISGGSFAEQAGCLARLFGGVHDWMQRGGHGDRVRLLIYLDEIGGGGGKTAFLPSAPYNPVSKSPIALVLRRARAFGVSLCLATQNPGDVDYKLLSNCGTWVIGKLRTKRDRAKVLEAVSDSGVVSPESLDDAFLQSLDPQEFALIRPSGGVDRFRNRWLCSVHRTLAIAQVELLGALWAEMAFENPSGDEDPVGEEDPSGEDEQVPPVGPDLWRIETDDWYVELRESMSSTWLIEEVLSRFSLRGRELHVARESDAEMIVHFPERAADGVPGLRVSTCPVCGLRGLWLLAGRRSFTLDWRWRVLIHLRGGDSVLATPVWEAPADSDE